MRKSTGTITVSPLMRMTLTEHTVAFDAVVYMLEGETEIKTESKPYMK